VVAKGMVPHSAVGVVWGEDDRKVRGIEGESKVTTAP
jgi:hypothetical protein